ECCSSLLLYFRRLRPVGPAARGTRRRCRGAAPGGSSNLQRQLVGGGAEEPGLWRGVRRPTGRSGSPGTRHRAVRRRGRRSFGPAVWRDRGVRALSSRPGLPRAIEQARDPGAHDGPGVGRTGDRGGLCAFDPL
ncbi:MAG: hypothetical protein AVDCRST_MAG78-2005, partial [uncultured Rubrobacteraceae bacterium]